MASDGLLSLVLQGAGPKQGHNFHGEFAPITEAKKFGTPRVGTTAGTAASLFSITPHLKPRTAKALRSYDTGVITECNVTVSPGPRVIDQVVTVTAAWVPSDWGTVTTLDEFGTFKHTVRQSMGGPFGLAAKLSVPLPPGMPHVLKSRITNAHPVFYMAVELESITGGPTVAAGSYLDVHYTLDYDLYGLYNSD